MHPASACAYATLQRSALIRRPCSVRSRHLQETERPRRTELERAASCGDSASAHSSFSNRPRHGRMISVIENGTERLGDWRACPWIGSGCCRLSVSDACRPDTDLQLENTWDDLMALRPLLILTVPPLAFSLAACTTEQLYSAAQGWQQTQCIRIPDKTDFDRCMAKTYVSYDSYKRRIDSK